MTVTDTRKEIIVRKRTFMKFAAGALTFSMLLALTACNQADTTTTGGTAGETAGNTENASTSATDTTVSDTDTPQDTEAEEEEIEAITDTLSDTISVTFSSYEQNVNWQSKLDTTITLNGDSATADGAGVDITEDTITITQKGTYELTGTLNDGQILVDVPEEDKVRLVLNNVDINCDDSAAIYVRSADKCVILLAEGSNNTITDGAFYQRTYADGEEPTACIYSKDDLTINGSGNLTVNGAYNNGIATSDDLHILNATLDVTALKNGLKGKDSVAIADATITIRANNDGIKSDQEGSTDKGFIYIKSGTISISAGDDALQCFNALYVKSPAVLTASADGQQINCDNVVSVDDGCLQ